ncbi:hypothetical protein AN221_21290 [Streptomyces nanshensis]|uniref:Uncharacterized protein n=1 Tax=Streptomyces nanshensis TaxID=518642 RepID=A0A1E7LR27_9ACTN|nr:hypothetical protein AN221_21290 [Streptomyces nanshensis]
MRPGLRVVPCTTCPAEVPAATASTPRSRSAAVSPMTTARCSIGVRAVARVSAESTVCRAARAGCSLAA